jgi:hypothetical protein
MKLYLSLSVLCVFAIVLPVLAQNEAHETVIDGRWEARVTTQTGEQATIFDFKTQRVLSVALCLRNLNGNQEWVARRQQVDV